MGVDVKDLPPAYQAQALRKLMERERRKQRAPLPSPRRCTNRRRAEVSQQANRAGDTCRECPAV